VALAGAVLWLVGVAGASAQHFHPSGFPHNIPDFCAGPTNVSTRSGAWSAPSTWSAGHVPAAGEKIEVSPGTDVAYDVVSDASLACVGVKGQLRFRTNASTKLLAATIFVYESGYLEIGREGAAVDPNAIAEIVFADRPLDLASDPEQYGVGLIGMGRVTIHGAPRSASFYRVTQEPRAGQATLTLEASPQGWRPGDKLIVPDTRQLEWNQIYAKYVPQWDEVSAASVAGNQVNLAAGLRFNHLGARTLDGVLEFLPHVGNLTRNVILRSQNPNGVRGHTIFVHRANVDIRYALFKDLGRTLIQPLDNTTFDQAGQVAHVGTNQIGRYPIHFHHVMGPAGAAPNARQYTVMGNAIDGVTKWGIAIHNTHYGLVRDNIVYNVGGAGIVTEDGNESFNVIEKNFVVRCWGTSGRLNGGREGIAFWMKAPNNYVRDNVAANILGDSPDASYGFEFVFERLPKLRIPKFPGADTGNDAEIALRNPDSLKILQFERNEVYGATESGLTFWWVGTSFDVPNTSVETSVIKDIRVWHVYNKGIYQYQSYRVLIDGFVLRGTNYASSACCQMAYEAGDYFGKDITLRNIDIQGMKVGLQLPVHAGNGTVTVENAFLRNGTNIKLNTPWTVSYRVEHIQPRRTVFRNVRHAAIPGKDLVAMSLNFTPKPSSSPIVSDQIFVENHNQQAGQNFRVYGTAQAPGFVTPQRLLNSDGTLKMSGSPDANRTNQENWNLYGLSVGGEVATCGNTMPGFVNAFVCGNAAAAPGAPRNVRITQ